MTTVVANGAARRDGNACFLAGTPAESGRTQTLKSGAVMAVRAISGDVVARVSDRAPSSSGVVGQTVSAVVISCAARRNTDASELTSAPGVSGGAQTFSGLAVVEVGAFSGDVITGVGGGAPCGSGKEAVTNTTSVVSGTTRRDGNTRK